MYAIFEPSNESRLVGSYYLTDNVQMVVDANISDILFDITSNEQLEAEVTARHPAPKGFTYLERHSCSGRFNVQDENVMRYAHQGKLWAYEVRDFLITYRNTPKEVIFEACKKYGKIKIGDESEIGGLVELNQRLRNYNVVIEDEFILDNYNFLTYEPEKIKKEKRDRERREKRIVSSGEIPCMLVEELHQWLYDVLFMHPMLRAYYGKETCEQFGKSKVAKMEAIFNHVRMMHSLYHCDKWRGSIHPKRESCWWQCRREGGVSYEDQVRKCFPYIEGMKKRVERMKAKLTDEDWKEWEEWWMWNRLQTIGRASRQLKVRDYRAYRNFVIFLEHEQRELK